MAFGRLVAAAAIALASALKSGADTPRSGQPMELVVDLPGGATMAMVWIPPGTFLMGTPAADDRALDEELPQHRVTLRRATRQTRALYRQVSPRRARERLRPEA